MSAPFKCFSRQNAAAFLFLPPQLYPSDYRPGVGDHTTPFTSKHRPAYLSVRSETSPQINNQLLPNHRIVFLLTWPIIIDNLIFFLLIYCFLFFTGSSVKRKI